MVLAPYHSDNAKSCFVIGSQLEAEWLGSGITVIVVIIIISILFFHFHLRTADHNGHATKEILIIVVIY